MTTVRPEVIHLVDDIGHIFAQSKRSEAEFPEYAMSLRKAISLARYVQEPLAELTYMWAQGVGAAMRGEEMLYLNLVSCRAILYGQAMGSGSELKVKRSRVRAPGSGLQGLGWRPAAPLASPIPTPTPTPPLHPTPAPHPCTPPCTPPSTRCGRT